MIGKKEDENTEKTRSCAKIKGTHQSYVSPSDSRLNMSSSHKNEPLYKRMISSFKPYDMAADGIDTSKFSDIEVLNYAISKHPLARRLKARHLQMIGIGGSIGTGLFIGSGHGLWQGGPAGQLIAYFVVGFALLCVMNALGEMSVQYPVSGAFHVFFARFVDPSWGFSLGLLYTFGIMILFPLELIACSLTIEYWTKSVHPSVWVAVFYVFICSIHLFGVRGFGEAEFVLAFIKVVAVVGFVILGICLICGAGREGYIGARYWHNPGAFNHGFKGVISCFISAGFTFGGIELLAFASAETVNPRRCIPRATKQVFWRILIFYLLTSITIGCLVPSTEPQLLSGNFDVDIASSPFVIAIMSSGYGVLPDIMNAVILVSVVSVGSASVYGSSRSLASLAIQGMLPKCVGYIDRAGRPLVGVLVSSIFGLLGFLVTDRKHQSEVFMWLLSISGLVGFLVWTSICFTHIRFRWAINRQARSFDEVLYISPTGVWGSYCGMIILSLVIAGQIWISIWPLGSHEASVKSFFISCLSLPLMIILWAGHKTYTRTWGQLLVDVQYVDLDAGRRDMDIDVIKQDVADEEERLFARPFWYRFYRFWC